ncbi:MAG: carboxypeptidase-like regulatory domain-containing protein, partial [Deltaproteobacteria bacterium]|nr:carboxypeptidase-like regulatory domain-containing protein [Deltaproteobacteria bacterium]
TLTVTDPKGLTATSQATVTITSTGNQPPTADPGPDRTVALSYVRTVASVQLDGTKSTDSDGIVTGYAWTGGVGSPDPADEAKPTVSLAAGTHTFTLVVTDDKGAAGAPKSVVITVAKEAVQLPTVTVLTPPPYQVAAGSSTPLTIAVSATSPDGRPVSLSASPLVASATFQAAPGVSASGTYVFQPGYVSSGTYLVTFTARDTYGLTTSTTVPIDVGATNRPPVLTLQDTATVAAGTALSIPVSATDPDGDVVALTATGLPPSAVLLPSVGNLTFSPSLEQVGVYDITVVASDGKAATGKQVTVTVSPPQPGGGGPGGGEALVLNVDPVESPSFLATQRVTGTVNSAAEPKPAQKSTLITGMGPTTGEQGATVTVTLTGDVGAYATHFAAGTSGADFGAGIAVKSLFVSGPSQALATIAIDPAAAVGARSVRVVTGSETAVSVNAFNVLSGKTTVTGRLLEPGTGVPIAGATVVIQGTTVRATTGSDGSFTLQGVPPGQQDLLVTALNHQSVVVRISPQIGVPVVVEDLELTPTVFDPATAPAASLGSVVGRGLGTFSFTGDPEEGKQLIRDTLFAVGGKHYGLVDEYGNQQNPNVEGNGIASLKPNGLTATVGRWHRGETMPLGVILQGMILAFDWENSNPPSLFRLLKSLQEQVNRAWSDPTDPANALLVAMFNRARTVSPEPPTLSQDTPLNAVQSYLFSVTVFGYVSSQVLYYQDLPDEGLGALGRNDPSDRGVLLAWNEWTRDLGVASDMPQPRALLLAQAADTRPVAYAGPTQTIPVSKDTGSIPVTLDGSTSYAKNGRTLVLYKWVRTSSADPDPADEMSPTIELMPKDQSTLIGRKHTFRLVVQDSAGEWSKPSEVLIVLDGPCRIIDAGDPSLVPWCEVFESVGTSQIVSLTSSVTIDPYLESLKKAISPTLVEDAATKATAVKRWTDYLELLDFTDQQYLSKVRAEDFVSSFEDSKKAAATIGKVTQFASAAAGIMTDVVGSIVGQVANSLFKDLIINDLIKNFVESARPNAPYVDSAVLVPQEDGGTQTVQVTFRPAQDEVGTAANGSTWKYYYAVYRQSRGVPGFGNLITVLPSYRFNAQLADVEDDEVGRAAMRYALQKSGRDMRLRFVDTDPAPGTNTYRLVTRVMRGHTIPNKPYIDPIVKAGFDLLVEKSTGASGKILVDGMFTCLDAMEAILTGVIYQWSEYSDPAMVYVGTAAESRFPRIDLAVAERTGEIFVSLPDTSKIFKWTSEGLKVRVDAGFKTPYQTGLASDAYGNLYTDNRASDLQFGGRLFRFSSQDNSRVLVGSTNYYSMLLQYARSTDVKGLTYALDGKDQVLFVADGMEQRINRLDLYDGAIVDRNVSQGYVSSSPDVQLFFQDTTRLFWDPAYRTLFFTQGNEILKAPKGGILERAFLPDANPFAGAWLTGIDGDENGLYVADSISGKVTLIPHWFLTTRGFGLPADYLKRYTVARFTGPLDIKVLGDRRQLVAVDAAGVRIAGFGLSGRLWDAKYNEPLAGANILIDDVLAGQTDAEGYFFLNNITTSGPVRFAVESLDGRVQRLSDRSGTSGQTIFVNTRGQTVLPDDLVFDPPPVPQPQDVDANAQNVQVDPSPFPA